MLPREGIDGAVYDSILRAPFDVRKELLGNIVVSGGPSMFPGLGERLQMHIVNLAPTTMNVCCFHFLLPFFLSCVLAFLLIITHS
jgi:actin beta/gamma 1